jgi:hypothetical protein
VINVRVSGSFKNMEAFGARMKQRTQFKVLEKYGPIGVAALSAATPVDEGDTAAGWYYEIVNKPGYFAIHWLNSHVVNPGNIPVAVLIQYGHNTRNGGRVQGLDFINPALRPIFEQMAADMWKEVTK